jgi:hypothetical protein
MTPQSKWGTDYTPPASVPVNAGVDAKTAVPKQVFGRLAETYFARLCARLVTNPARKDDASFLARMEKLGMKSGARVKMDAFGAEVRKAIEESVATTQQVDPRHNFLVIVACGEAGLSLV